MYSSTRRHIFITNILYVSYDDSRVIIVLMKLQNILHNAYTITITV